MDIRIYIVAIYLAIQFPGFAQFELQRKYEFDDAITVAKLQSKLETDAIHYIAHSEFIYEDIYVDDEQLSLYKAGYSLRFRKRIFNDSTFGYSFQLKTEMKTTYDTRIEIDEPELDFYRIYNDSIPRLHSLIDSVLGTSNESYSAMLTDWMKSKFDAPIAPFQAIKKLDPLLAERLKNKLQPKLIGRSTRYRGHLYANKTDQLKMNRKAYKDQINFFTSNPNYVWLFESSIDESTFRRLDNPGSQCTIRELEIESKYSDFQFSNQLLDGYIENVSSKIDLKSNIDSKYKQSISILY